MERLPPPILEHILSYLVSGSKEDRLHAMSAQKEWQRLARKVFYPAKTLRYACTTGDLECVLDFLSDRRIDPTTNANSAICYSARHGHVEIVRALLQDGRVNPGAQDNVAICYAAQHGHIEIVRMLLKWKKTSSSESSGLTKPTGSRRP